MNDTSTSGFPPYFLCSSVVSFPPENAYLLICVNQIQVMPEDLKRYGVDFEFVVW